MELSFAALLLVVAAFVLAGMVKAITGMGLPLVAMGILGSVLSPVAAAALLVAPAFVTNVWQFVGGPQKRMLLARLWPLALATFLGTFAGALFLTGGNVRATTAALGAVLIVYAAYTFLARPVALPPSWQPALGPIVGLMTGVIGGATGITAVPVVPYLQSLGLGRDELIQALALSFTASAVALGLALALHGAFPATSLVMSALAIVPALGGMRVGQMLRSRISPPLFRRVFLVVLAALGAEMLLRPLY